MTTIGRLTRKLQEITREVEEVEHQQRKSREVKQTWPGRVNDLRQEMLSIYYDMGQLESEVEEGVARDLESDLTYIEVADRLRDIMTIIGQGSGGQNLMFMQAVSPENLSVFCEFLIIFPEAFKEVLKRMEDQDYEAFLEIVTSARQNS